MHPESLVTTTEPIAPAPRPGEALARFHVARGHRVFEAAGALWTKYRGPFFASLPHERCLEPDPAALDAALQRERVLAVRYPGLARGEVESGLFVCRTAGYGLPRVERRHRSQVKKGLDACALRAVDPDELLAMGLEANLHTMARQGRTDPEFAEPERWRRFVAAVRAVPEVRVHGAFVGGRLSAYLVSCRDGAWVHELYKFSRTDELDLRTNPALDYHVLAAAAAEPGVEAVSNGYVSVTRGAEALHHYKLCMGFEVEPHPLAVRFHPTLQPLLATRLASRAALALARRRPASARLELAAQVLRAAWSAR